MAAAPSPLEALTRLVAFDTVSARPNRAAADWIADAIRPWCAAVDVFEPAPGKANLLATVGPAGPGGIVLSGHTDVVPVDGQSWTSDPFTLTERDGRLHGRGTADMKGFVALAVALVPHFSSLALRRPIHLALSCDEEIGCLGAPALVARLAPLAPSLAIVGEPTALRPVNGHKGCDLFRLRITGRDAHSSAPALGVNAIHHAAAFVAFLDGLFDELRAAGAGDRAFDPPHSTFNVGRIDGGRAVNITAASCEALWEFRTVPGDDTAAILARIEGFVHDTLAPRLRRAHPEAGLTLERLASVPMLRPEPDGAAEALARRLTGRPARTVAFGSEAGLFQAAGMSAIVCGPGDIAQAHQPDEFITVEQLRAGEDFLRGVGAWAATA